MNKRTPLLILVTISLMLSGCVGPDVENDTAGLTPASSEVAPTPTPTPAQTPTLTPTRLNETGDDVSTNETNDSSETWSVCDPRHNESWLYAHKCGMYAHGGGGGGNHFPPPPVPEMPSIYMVVIGLFGLKALQWYKRR